MRRGLALVSQRARRCSRSRRPRRRPPFVRSPRSSRGQRQPDGRVRRDPNVRPPGRTTPPPGRPRLLRRDGQRSPGPFPGGRRKQRQPAHAPDRARPRWRRVRRQADVGVRERRHRPSREAALSPLGHLRHRSTASPGALPRCQAPGRPSLRYRTGRRSCATSAPAATRCSRPATTRTRALDDFAPALPHAAAESVAGPNSTCPNTQITKKPKAKTTDRTPKFEFSGGDGFLCSLDGSKAEACDSGVFEPGKLSRGKHKFAVGATETGRLVDGTPGQLLLEDRQEEVASARGLPRPRGSSPGGTDGRSG